MSLIDDIREKLKGASGRLADEVIYENVLKEIESGKRKGGVWAKALSESDGDIEKAKALYIKLRVQSIFDEIKVQEELEEEKERLKLEKEEEQEAAREDEIKRLREESEEKREQIRKKRQEKEQQEFDAWKEELSIWERDGGKMIFFLNLVIYLVWFLSEKDIRFAYEIWLFIDNKINAYFYNTGLLLFIALLAISKFHAHFIDPYKNSGCEGDTNWSNLAFWYLGFAFIGHIIFDDKWIFGMYF